MGNGVSGLEAGSEDGKRKSGRVKFNRRSRPFSQADVIVPLDVGTRDMDMPRPAPENLGIRNSSAPAASAGPQRDMLRKNLEGRLGGSTGGMIGLGQRRKRESTGRSSSKQSADEYMLRRFSFQRRKRQSTAEMEGNLVGKHARHVVLDVNEITALADSSQSELATHGYTLEQWEQIYKQMTRMYDKMSNPRNFDSETINSDESETGKVLANVPKWTLERALDKVSRCIESSPQFKDKEKTKWERWEAANVPRNKVALRQMEAFVPVDIKFLTAKDIVKRDGRSWPLAKRLVEKKILQVLHMSPEDVRSIHASDFGVKGRFDYTGLDLIELRAVYYSTREIPDIKWRKGMRQFLYEYTVRDKSGTLSKFCKRHHAYSYRPNKPTHLMTDEDLDALQEKERITTVLRAKARCLFGEIENKSHSKKKELLTRVERITGSHDNKYTRMVRNRLSYSDSGSENSSEEYKVDDEDEIEDEEDLAHCFDNFYATGSFSVPKHKRKVKEDDSDVDEMEAIEQLVRELAGKVSSPQELESLLATVFE